MNFQSIRPLRKNELMYEMTDINMLELIQRVIFISEDYLLIVMKCRKKWMYPRFDIQFWIIVNT